MTKAQANTEAKEKKAKLPVASLITISIALISLSLGVINWFAQRDSQWEASRALVNFHIDSQGTQYLADQQYARFDIVISNVGEISFLIRNLEIELSANAGLNIDWQKISLLNADFVQLPLNLAHFSVVKEQDNKATYAFDNNKTSGVWHIVDPNRTISIPVLLPVQGDGVLTVYSTLFSHEISLMNLNNDIEQLQLVNGKLFTVSPEYGFENKLSNQQHSTYENSLIYPFSASQIIVINDENKLTKSVKETSE